MSILIYRYCPLGNPIGSILLCDKDESQEPPAEVGILDGKNLGLVLESKGPRDITYIYACPATVFSKDEFERILKFSSEGQGKIDQSEVEEKEAPPSIVSISSRGPNPITPNILKVIFFIFSRWIYNVILTFIIYIFSHLYLNSIINTPHYF